METGAGWHLFRWVLLLGSVLIDAAAAFEARAGLQIVLNSGADSPDGNGDFQLLNAPTINAAGQLAFVSQLTGTTGGTNDNLALYRRDVNGTLTAIARRGNTFEGKSITTFFPALANIDDSGTLMTVLALAPNPATFWNVFSDGGQLFGLNSPNMTSPSGQNYPLLAITSTVVNGSGNTVYRALFSAGTPQTSESGLYERDRLGVHYVRLLSGFPSPLGGTVTNTGGRPTLNEAGQIGTIFTIDVGGPSSIKAIARIDGTTPQELVREGDVIFDANTTLGTITSSSGFINSNGEVAFAANYTQGLASRQGVFVADNFNTKLVGPGLLPGESSLTTNMRVMGIDDSGRVGFLTDFTAPGADPKSGIYLSGSGAPSVVAIEDTATPIAGKFFRAFFAEGIAMNDNGQIAFLAELSNTANGAAAGRGIYAYDPVTGLQQIARTGDALQGSTITTVYFNGAVNLTSTVSPDLSLSGLNNSGQVAFSYTLADGRDGMAIWSPEVALEGDYNGNGVVDAADYVVWRDSLTQTGANLPADGNHSGTVDAGDFDVWRANFGNASGAGSLTYAAVPEPCYTLLLATVVFLFPRRTKR